MWNRKKKSASEPQSDKDLIALADELYSEEQLLEAARLLRRVKNNEVLTAIHKWILEKASEIEEMLPGMMTDAPGGEWNKLAESHGKRDTLIYYKVQNGKLTARIETPLEQSLLVPIMSVFNETELYPSWMPRFERPFKVGIRGSEIHRVRNRFNQLLVSVVDMPMPLSTRELAMDIVAVDDIEQTGAVFVKIVNASDDDPHLPKANPSTVRMSYDGGLLFRKCPPDHPVLAKTKNSDNADRVLVCLQFFADAHVAFVPRPVVNFGTRTVVGRMWSKMLEVAEEVRDGKRPLHAETIKQKQDTYDWLDGRMKSMLKNYKKDEEE